jgi:phosphocarrier protein FPr
MVGIVVVSHSRRLAEAAVELALQMVRGAPPPIEIAAGLDDHVLGTDAARVKEAIERVASPDGVLVMMDLGSALLSAELALELRGDDAGCPVVLSDAPLVEGLVAAVTLATAGAALDEVAGDASRAGQIKTALLGPRPTVAPSDGGDEPSTVIELAVRNEHGLHARPAARLVETVRRFDADVTVRNVTQAGAPVSGRSVSALSTLGVLAGHRVEVRASGRQAREALAAVAALVRRNFDEPVSVLPTTVDAGAGPRAASPGIGIGPKASLLSTRPPVIAAATSGAARDQLIAAVEAARAELVTTREHVARTAGGDEAAIFDAHLLLLDDEQLIGNALVAVDAGAATAADAWNGAVEELAASYGSLADPYQASRAGDIRAVGDLVLAHLLGVTTGALDMVGVVVAPDLTPTQVALLDPAKVAAIVTASGSPVSHAAILARSLGIPAVVGAGDEVLAVPDGTMVVVDGAAGVVIADPGEGELARYRERAAQERARADDLLAGASRPAITGDGTRIDVLANIASVEDARNAVRFGADGVGLLRTEFLFLDRREPPEEDEQLAVYEAIADALEGRRLTVRTLDIGGDKPVPYLAAGDEGNPFLGSRGLRLSLRHIDLFREQLRAVLRVALHHPVTVLFPMVTTIDELRAARAVLAAAAVEVGCRPGTLPAGFEVGAMVEVPAFALRARAAVPLVEVLSIGTNDLTQYALAAERGNAEVAELADPLDPAVLRLVSEVAHAATAGTRVAVCGELAADPRAATLLVGLGVSELSMAPAAIPAAKEAVRSASLNEARHLAALALRRDSAASVRALLNDVG